MSLIRHSIVTYEVEIPETDVRDALIKEAMEKNGLMHEGKPIPGLTYKVLYNGSRRNGTYIVKITRDVAKSGQAQLPKPECSE